MIKALNLKKSFGEKVVLQDISADFFPGKCNLIIGASGSGKTVLQKLLVGLYEPDSGHILYGDQDMTTMEQKERKILRQQIGMLFQGSALFDSMTVEQNILFPLDMFSKMNRDQKKKRVNEVLERVNLKDAHKKYPSQISGGMKKRVGIARAIVLNPQYLFCDEPNSGLDPKTAIVIDKLIHSITQEFDITTIIITHDMNSVIEIGENIMFVHKGQNWWTGDRTQILNTNNRELFDFVFASEYMKNLFMAGKK